MRYNQIIFISMDYNKLTNDGLEVQTVYYFYEHLYKNMFLLITTPYTTFTLNSSNL